MKRITTIITLVCLSSLLFAQGTYTPSESNIEARKFVKNARLGIFIHWGVYSMLGDGEWVMNNQKINYKEYEKLAGGFYPSRFCADEWIAAFKDAEAEYMTITSRHHDGFSMWHSTVNPYNVYDASPFHRDVIGEIAAACRRQDFRLHLYFSHLDWYREDYWPLGRTGRDAGRPEGDEGDWNHYRKYMDDMLTELLTQYGPIGCIWFDGVWDKCSGHRELADSTWGLTHQYELIHSLQPACLVADNHHMQPFEGEDMQIFEQDIPGEDHTGFNDGQQASTVIPIESCITMNGSWGYCISDKKYKSIKDVVTLIVRAAGKDANVLLNIGPRPDGCLPVEAVTLLHQLGDWMRAYGNESVKGTSGAFYPEQEWGTLTRKDNTIYVHILKPVDTVTLPFAKVKKVTTFEGTPLKFSTDKTQTSFTVPARGEDIIDQIIRIQL